ncbi:hypothetical protein DFH08DRAFT_962079 [Mycena albidolilacea]|uniref:Uncharacterized protein n=1 Tax=Mycena albidolilacea TaxID=1033008 RepID=A0AAD6ZY52_9AGAR|nr:hypothetical protein DFH08DRAFT_962079 [Mycena albidolilacea]
MSCSAETYSGSAPWHTMYPFEQELGIICVGPAAEPLTPEQLKSIGKATNEWKGRLRTWMRWRKASNTSRAVHKRSGLLKILKAKKKTHPLRAVEVYQKLYRDKIWSEVMQWGYRELNKEAEADRVTLARDPDAEPSVLTPEEEQEVEEQVMARVCANHAARMSLLRTTTMEVFAAEPEEVRAEVLLQMEKMNKERGSGVNDDADTETQRPEEYQHAIDQLPEVMSKFTGAVEAEAGWMGFFMAGGPMPNREGAISIKTFCFGTTPNGANFAASHSNFGEVKAEFGQFFKHAFPHDVHDAWAIVSEAEADTIVPGGLILIPFDSDTEGGSDKEGQKASSSATPAAPPSTAKPKHVCRKKPTAAASAVVSPSALSAPSPAPTLALSTQYAGK